MKIKKYTQESLIFNVFEAKKNLEKKLNLDFDSLGINYIQFLILTSIYLEGKKQLSPKDISEVLQVSKSQLSQNISLLDASFLLKRSLDVKDARKVTLILTTTGKDLTRKAMKAHQKREKELEDGISLSQNHKLLKFLTEM